uniref:Interleukin-2 receptor subunit beta N-terminal domain-containing protein n=1 Tax=Oreochromis aureus TaxID=47969 RepID=A0AAZ1XUQ4_OREAU
MDDKNQKAVSQYLKQLQSFKSSSHSHESPSQQPLRKKTVDLMERNKKTLSLFILLPVLLLCRSDECPSLPQNLSCYTDYNRNITCLWNSRNVSNDTACTIHAQHNSRKISYSASCHLKPVDVSRPALKKCSLIFEMEYTFLSSHELSLNLNCNQMKSGITSFKPSCRIKVNPPAEPKVNFTSVSWLSQVPEHERISSYRSELQWKKQDQSWSDPTVQKNLDIQCEDECKAELEPDKLIQGERYEARVHVRSVKPQPEGAWSDWSPTASWESPVGTIKPPSDLSCYTDYNRNITCLWNSRNVSNDTACIIHAQHNSRNISYSASCHLKPVDVSRPALKKCSLIFEMEYTFLSSDELSLNLSCNQMKSGITSFKPSCHIKVNPPAEPKVNFTSVSWLSQVPEHERISSYRSELQWKKQDQSWSDPTVQKNLDIQCEDECKAELEPDKLIQGKRYDARVHVRSVKPQPEGAWSDWSPTASWESPVGTIKPPSEANLCVSHGLGCLTQFSHVSEPL